ncbi:MAG: cyclase family protein [Acidobacteria bacterium]|nr:cyclase family protein [Acidobacteriota bacterium]
MRAAVLLLASTAFSQSINPQKLIDLTYTYDSKTVYWPNAKGFEHRKDNWARTPLGYWYAAGGFSTDEHGGTHVDSPIHFAEGKLTLEAIPVEKLTGPAFVVDITSACAANKDYTATRADVEAFEKRHGPIPRGAIVLFKTGWGKYWPDKARYLGSATPGDVANLHFPGISPPAAEFLVRRGVVGVGIDTASTDHGPSKRFETHQVLSEANVYGIENVANIDRLPAKGATLIVAPMKIAGGTGGPARILAVLP